MTTDRRPSIVLGFTVPISLILMRELPELLVQDGWDVHVVSSPGAELAELGDIPHVFVHPIRMTRDPSPISDVVALAGWIRLLRRLRPDVVSVGTPKAGLLGSVAAMLTRVPRRVYLQRGLRLETARGALRMVLMATERLASHASHAVVAVSPSLKSRLIELRLAPASKVIVLGPGSSNGVDVDHFANEARQRDAIRLAKDLPLEPGVPVVGFVGRLAPDKGLSELGVASKLLLDRGVPHQLLVVGGIDSKSATSATIDAIMTGPVSDPAPYFRMMDVFCLPTYREGFPNVVLEAGAAGIPTVTTDATGAVDSVKPGVTGLIVPARSSSQLADALETILTARAVREAMGAAAHDWISSEFPRQVVARRTANFYASQLSPELARTLTHPIAGLGVHSLCPPAKAARKC